LPLIVYPIKLFFVCIDKTKANYAALICPSGFRIKTQMIRAMLFW